MYLILKDRVEIQMNLAEIKQRERMTPVHIRLPISVREKAQEIARNQSTDEVKVNESDVYRTLIEKFLPEVDTKRINNPLQDVTKGGEPS